MGLTAGHDNYADMAVLWRPARWLSTGRSGAPGKPGPRGRGAYSRSRDRRGGAAGPGPGAGGKPGRRGRRTTWYPARASVVRCTRPMSGWSSSRSRRRRASAGDWTPCELRRTFVPLLPGSGVPIEQIADAVGHSSTRTTQVCTGTNSGRSRVPLPLRSVRCSRAEERPTEAKTESLGSQLGYRDLDRWDD